MNTDTLPSIRHLKMFCVVAELNSIRKAADMVYLSQPAITQAIKKMEGQIGTDLFHRRNTGTYPTEAGTILAERAQLMFDKVEAALVEFGIKDTSEAGIERAVRRMTRKQVQVLSAIVASGSFDNAAGSLGISPSSLYRAARNVEANLGKPLFQNSFFGVIATGAGGRLARKLTLAMREIDWAVDEILMASGKMEGELRVGAGPLAGSFVVGEVLSKVADAFPNIKITVHTGDGASLVNQLLMGGIDFIIGLNRMITDSDELVQEELFASRYVVVAREGHPLSSRASVTIEDLEQYKWVAPTPNAKRRAAFDALFETMTAPPMANIQSYSLSTIRTMISNSDRLTLLTKFEFDNERKAGNLTLLRFDGFDRVDAVGVAHRANWKPTRLHGEFLRMLRDRARHISGAGYGLKEIPQVAQRRHLPETTRARVEEARAQA